MKLRYPISITIPGFTMPGLLCVPLLLGACGGTATDPTATAAPATLRPAAAPHALPLMRRVFETVGNLPVSPDQRVQLDEVAADVEPRAVATKLARDGVLEMLATQVEQGTIDRAAMAPLLEAMRASAADERSANQAQLRRVNGILTDPQRYALVDTMRQTQSERPRAFEHYRSRQPRLLRGLGLSPEQRQQVHAAREAARSEYDHYLIQHRNDGYAMTPLPHIQRRIAVLEHVLPILTPAQRAIVAQRLRNAQRDTRAEKGE